MVAQTVDLPNIKKMFIPDAGHMMIEVDLAGADAQVVAWEANDEELKEAFRAGLKVHMVNVRAIFPEKVKGWSDEAIKATDRAGGIYHECKQAVHGTNYGGGARTIAGTLGWLVREAEEFQHRWFQRHPMIKDWHRRTEAQLAANRTVANSFGYRRVYFDRIEGLLPQALAWIPQSTVAIVCEQGALQVRDQCPWVDLLLQVHDSLLMQYPIAENKNRFLIEKALKVVAPYHDPLLIPWSIKASGRSWGHCEPVAWVA